jgi:DNA-binding NarL/FixJ family response regulator
LHVPACFLASPPSSSHVGPHTAAETTWEKGRQRCDTLAHRRSAWDCISVGNVSFLIAEDDELVGRMLVRALAEHGRTELVTTAREARTALASQSFTAVVVDVALPDGSGLDLISDARSHDPCVSALVVSGGVDERRLAEAHHLGAPYLLKPIDARQLGLFAMRMQAKTRRRQEKIAALVERWKVQYDFTPAEAAIVELAAHGAPRARLADLRNVAASTVKKQVQVILTKTGDSTLEAAVSRLLRAIVDEG